MHHRARIPSLGGETSKGKPPQSLLPKRSMSHRWCLRACSSLVLCSSPHLSTGGCRVPPGKDPSLLTEQAEPSSLSHTQAEPSQRDNFKSGWEGKLCFYQPYWVPGKIRLSSLFGHIIAVCHLLAPTPCKLQISSLLSATGSTGRVEQSSKQMRYYLLVPVPAAHNSGRTDCSNYDAFFIHSNESITFFTCEQEVIKQK